MYMILWWKNNDNYLDYMPNDDGSIKLFETLEEADDYVENHDCFEDMRIISIGEAVY